MNGRQTYAAPDVAVSDAQLNVVTRACTHKSLMSAFEGEADMVILFVRALASALSWYGTARRGPAPNSVALGVRRSFQLLSDKA